jgi:ribosome-binding factor A
MAKEYSRALRVADLLQRELANVIQNELQDPELGMVTISGVRVSRDLAYAHVYVTVMKNRRELAAVVQTLNESAGHLRHMLAGHVVLRSVPRLKFSYDESIVRGNQLSALITAAVAADDAKHQNGDD